MAESSSKRRRRKARRRGDAPVARPRADARRAPAVQDEPPAGGRRRRRGPGLSRSPAGGLSFKARREEAPKPIWHPVPVTEVLILLGMVIALVGAATQNVAPIAGGLIILAAASVELSLREHFAGYRSHSVLLSSIAGLAVASVVGFGLQAVGVSVPALVALGAGLVVAVVVFFRLRRVFRRRTGGLAFRV